MNYKLKDLCEITSSRRIFAKEYTSFGIPFFRSKEIIECSQKGSTIPTIFISNNRYNELLNSEHVPIIGDILLSAIGANRGYPWLVNIVPFYFKDGNVIWLRNFKSMCNSKYLSYYLSTKKCIHTLQASSEHSAQGAITIDLIKSLDIELPSLTIQQHIVNTIGTVDDLIEKYNKQIEKLIYIGDLMLVSFQTKGSLTKYATISLGGTPSRKHPEYWNGNIKWINSGAITGTPAIMNESEYITTEGVKHSATKSANCGDTVLSIIEPSKNKVAVVLDDDVYFNQSVICISAKEVNHKGLIFFASRYLIDEIKGYATGAAQQSLNKDMLDKSNILIPEKDVIENLNFILSRIEILENKIRKLNNLKAILLSKYF